jgi:uncharacterized membrane protein
MPTARKSSARPRPGPLRTFTARPNLIVGLAVALAAYFLTTFTPLRGSTRALVGWDIGVVGFLAVTFRSMMRADIDRMRHRATDQDAGKQAVLLLSIVAAGASVAAIAAEMIAAKNQSGAQQAAQVALTAGTIALSWVFVHTVFAVHYAHVYYLGEDDKSAHAEGLAFPGEKAPDYWDFIHFAFVIGAAAQTADIVFTSREMRRLGTLHSLIAFTFNTAILAVMINLVAGLLQ